MNSSRSEDLRAVEEEILRGAACIGQAGEVPALDHLLVRVSPGHLQAVADEIAALTGYLPTRASVSAGGRTVTLARPGLPPIVLEEGTEEVQGTGLAAIAFRVEDPDDHCRQMEEREIPCRRIGGTVETERSPLTGIALRFAGPAGWRPGGREVPLPCRVGERPYHRRIGRPDHVAVRVRAEDRAAAVLWFMQLTGGRFVGSEYVVPFRSANSVVRLERCGFALNVVSGTAPGEDEPFLARFGPGAHHVAFETAEIRETVAALRGDGTAFSLPLTGAREEGILQAMTARSPHTGLMIEYIERYGGYEGYFSPELARPL
ncbi:MAG: VOC family protein [Methanofollis sp.]|uniref:VOC family protein n=1 Tax=Methanofollis sp. TaxID=2052835 RepID=UPI00261A39A3|nr:VOC family protein [Methanofollis sp.]MDD4254305.1 VOC family protein [Methanofollis sp.]